MRFGKLRIILVLMALFLLLTGLAAVASADFTGRIESIERETEDSLKIIVTEDGGSEHEITVSLTEGKDFKVGDNVKVTEYSGVKTIEKIEEVSNQESNELSNAGIELRSEDIELRSNEEDAAIPEFPTVALPMVAVFSLMFIFGARNKKV